MNLTARSASAAAALLLSLALASFPAAASEPLTVVTKEAPPFVYRDDAGNWRGLSIELWSEISAKLGMQSELVEMSLDEMIDAVARGEVDAAVAALTITAEREERLDFTHPFFSSGLGIAVSASRTSFWTRIADAVLSADFARAVLALAVVLLAVGAVVWWFERRRNPDQFGGATVRGIGSGFWWSAVTMTTVGYGDKAPVTFAGRLVALVWMFASLILVSGFTAAIASALTLSGLEGEVRGPQDLPHSTVGSIAGTTSASYLEQRGISFRPYETPEEALADLAAGRLNAVVYDRPILRHLARAEIGPAVRMLPHILEQQQYAIALPPGSDLREPINRAMLKIIDDPAWQETIARYLGE